MLSDDLCSMYQNRCCWCVFLLFIVLLHILSSMSFQYFWWQNVLRLVTYEQQTTEEKKAITLRSATAFATGKWPNMDLNFRPPPPPSLVTQFSFNFPTVALFSLQLINNWPTNYLSPAFLLSSSDEMTTKNFISICWQPNIEKTFFLKSSLEISSSALPPFVCLPIW